MLHFVRQGQAENEWRSARRQYLGTHGTFVPSLGHYSYRHYVSVNVHSKNSCGQVPQACTHYYVPPTEELDRQRLSLSGVIAWLPTAISSVQNYETVVLEVGGVSW